MSPSLFAYATDQHLRTICSFSIRADAVVGLAGFVRLLSWLLRNYHSVAVAVLMGFMVGSLRKIWTRHPRQPQQQDWQATRRAS
ncbi:MAG: undecaprenyl phosphate translocase family protein [Candidatus Brachytrichaceae bacterium NZ_4S206]